MYTENAGFLPHEESGIFVSIPFPHGFSKSGIVRNPPPCSIFTFAGTARSSILLFCQPGAYGDFHEAPG